MIAGQYIGPYRIIRLLDEGGMAMVYEAQQDPLERHVAIKTLKPELARNQDVVTRFLNEAKILSRLSHPSLVQVSDYGHAPDGTAYLVMEFLRGHSLGHRLRELSKQGQRLPLATALHLAFEIADVLAMAHAAGIIHRDLKPDNLMLISDPAVPGGERAKLLDFGIAKLTQAGGGAEQTKANLLMGTPRYMSPEQCMGAGSVDAKSDVYSLGCLLYETLAGRPPFVAEGDGELFMMHLSYSPPPLRVLAPAVPRAVAKFVHELLTKDKIRRPNMSETADAIGRLLSKLSGGGPVVRSRPPGALGPDAAETALLHRPAMKLGGGVPLMIASVMVVLVAMLWTLRHYKLSQPLVKSQVRSAMRPVPAPLRESDSLSTAIMTPPAAALPDAPVRSFEPTAPTPVRDAPALPSALPAPQRSLQASKGQKRRGFYVN